MAGWLSGRKRWVADPDRSTVSFIVCSNHTPASVEKIRFRALKQLCSPCTCDLDRLMLAENPYGIAYWPKRFQCDRHVRYAKPEKISEAFED